MTDAFFSTSALPRSMCCPLKSFSALSQINHIVSDKVNVSLQGDKHLTNVNYIT